MLSEIIPSWIAFAFRFQPYDNSNSYDSYSHDTERPHLSYDAPAADMPDVIKQFIQYFYNAIKEGRVDDIQELYENS